MSKLIRNLVIPTPTLNQPQLGSRRTSAQRPIVFSHTMPAKGKRKDASVNTSGSTPHSKRLPVTSHPETPPPMQAHMHLVLRHRPHAGCLPQVTRVTSATTATDPRHQQATVIRRHRPHNGSGHQSHKHPRRLCTLVRYPRSRIVPNEIVGVHTTPNGNRGPFPSILRIGRREMSRRLGRVGRSTSGTRRCTKDHQVHGIQGGTFSVITRGAACSRGEITSGQRNRHGI